VEQRDGTQRRLDAAERWRRIFCHEMWNVGVVDQSAEDIVARGIARPVRWLTQRPRDTLFADPAWLQRPDGRGTVFLEAMKVRKGRGEIWSADIAPGEDIAGAKFMPTLSAPFHMSYPFPAFDDLFQPMLTAETWQAGQAAIWHLADGQWRQSGVLMGQRPVVDPTIWRGPDRWWLFCTFHDDGADRFLHLFFADSPQGPWNPHPMNPVVSGFGVARPAGPLFRAGGLLIRPAQDCAKTYGGGVVLNAVRVLTVDAYHEEVLRRIDPIPGPFPSGLHTFCPAGEVTLIDGKKWQFDPLEFLERVGRKLRHLAYPG
jgi:hypothetical protein